MDASFKVAEVAATRGAAWLGEAFGLYRRAPLAWIAICAGWLAITFALILIPFGIGGVIANFLQPAFFASFAICAYRQSAGERVVAGDLFLGFKRNMRTLVILGAVLLTAEIAIFFLMAIAGLPMSTTSSGPLTMSEFAEELKGKEWIIAMGFLLTVMVKGALWFAPPLITFHGMGATQAMRWSAYAAIANLGAMVVYGVTLFAIFFLALLPWALGLLIVIPMMAISTWVGYNEVFESK